MFGLLAALFVSAGVGLKESSDNNYLRQSAINNGLSTYNDMSGKERWCKTDERCITKTFRCTKTHKPGRIVISMKNGDILEQIGTMPEDTERIALCLMTSYCK